MAGLKVGSIGEYIREQRSNAQYSLRQLADLAGVSNPYLSQVERGLRKPSAEILQQIAKALRISAETLYVQAGILEDKGDEPQEVVAVILADPATTDRQKRVLVEIYESFRRENAVAAEAEASKQASDQAVAKAVGAETTTRKTTSQKWAAPKKAGPKKTARKSTPTRRTAGE